MELSKVFTGTQELPKDRQVCKKQMGNYNVVRAVCWVSFLLVLVLQAVKVCNESFVNMAIIVCFLGIWNCDLQSQILSLHLRLMDKEGK